MFAGLRIGLLILRGGGRRSLVRFLSVVLGVAAAVGLMLFALSVQSAIALRNERAAARLGTVGRSANDTTLTLETDTSFENKTIVLIRVAAVGPASPVPLGARAIPSPGSSLVSPALADVLHGPDASLLNRRVPRPAVETIGSDGLLSPSELVAYVGDTASHLKLMGASNVTSFTPSPNGHPTPLGVRIAVAVGVISLTVPIVLLLALLSRLSAQARDARIATLRLIGASNGQIFWVAATEGVLSSTVGVIVGLGLFFGLRWGLARLGRGDFGFFTADLPVNPYLACVIAVAVMIVSLVATSIATRSAIRTPLGTARRKSRPLNVRIRTVPLLVGVTLLMLAAAASQWLVARPQTGGTVVGLGLLATLVGLWLVAPVFGERAGELLHRRVKSPSALIGTGRARVESRSTGRMVSGITCLVFLGGITIPLFATQAAKDQVIAQAGSVLPGVVFVESARVSRGVVSDLSSVVGVGKVVPLVEASVWGGYRGMIASCLDLRAVLVSPPDCSDPSPSPIGAFSQGGPMLKHVSVVPYLHRARRASWAQFDAQRAETSQVAIEAPWAPWADVYVPAQGLVGFKTDRIDASGVLLVSTSGASAVQERIREVLASPNPWRRSLPPLVSLARRVLKAPRGRCS